MRLTHMHRPLMAALGNAAVRMAQVGFRLAVKALPACVKHAQRVVSCTALTQSLRDHNLTSGIGIDPRTGLFRAQQKCLLRSSQAGLPCTQCGDKCPALSRLRGSQVRDFRPQACGKPYCELTLALGLLSCQAWSAASPETLGNNNCTYGSYLNAFESSLHMQAAIASRDSASTDHQL